MDKCYTNHTNIGKFISNINGNWRNSIYITCSVCKNKKEYCCSDILVTFDSEGKPVFITVTDANYIFATVIDKSECLLEISNAKFKGIFERFIKKHTLKEESGEKCYTIKTSERA